MAHADAGRATGASGIHPSITSLAPQPGLAYVTQSLGIPEVKVVAATEVETIAQVTEALAQWLAAAKVVHVAVPGDVQGNSWLDAFGRSANNPDFAEFLAELQRQRTMDTLA